MRVVPPNTQDVVLDNNSMLLALDSVFEGSYLFVGMVWVAPGRSYCFDTCWSAHCEHAVIFWLPYRQIVWRFVLSCAHAGAGQGHDCGGVSGVCCAAAHTGNPSGNLRVPHPAVKKPEKTYLRLNYMLLAEEQVEDWCSCSVLRLISWHVVWHTDR